MAAFFRPNAPGFLISGPRMPVTDDAIPEFICLSGNRSAVCAIVMTCGYDMHIGVLARGHKPGAGRTVDGRDGYDRTVCRHITRTVPYRGPGRRLL